MEQTGGPHVLRLQRVDRPEPGPGEVLVRVHAASVSHADLTFRDGTEPLGKGLPHILGGEVAGTVEATAAGAHGTTIGDRVLACSEAMGRDRDGGYAEFVIAETSELYPVPNRVGFATAAAVGRTFAIAWVALVHKAEIGRLDRFENRERVLVTGASGGVGAAAVQIARWKGATVVAVADGTKAKRLMSLGAHRVVSRSADDLSDRVIHAFGGRRATLIFDSIARNTLRSNVGMLERKGRIICAEDRRADVDEVDARDVTHILAMVEEGTFHPVVDSILPLSAAAAAHKRVATGVSFGKIVLVPDPIYESDDEELLKSREEAGPR